MTERLEGAYRRERHRLLGFIRARLAGLEEAEDLLQEVFVQAAQTLSAAQPIDNLVGWLYTAARNRIIDRYRSRRPAVSLQGGEETATLESLLRDSGVEVERELVRGLVMEVLESALAALPEAQREVFLLQALEGVSFREISQRTGTSINTLLARKRYAVRFLRRRLEELRGLIAELDR